MIEDPMMRLVYANQVQNIVDNPFCLFDEEVSADSYKNIQIYLKNKNIRIPKFPDDVSRSKDIIKMMYLSWISIEALNLICELVGEDND